jgi:hypothetical protein
MQWPLITLSTLMMAWLLASIFVPHWPARTIAMVVLCLLWTALLVCTKEPRYDR